MKSLPHLLLIFLFFSLNTFAQATIVWKQVNNSSYSFKYPENWKLEFKPNSHIRYGWSLGDMSYDLQIPLPEEIANKYKPILNEMIQSFVFKSE